MLAHIQGLLTPAEVAEIRTAMEQGSYSDGAETAGGSAKLVKHNLQLRQGSPERQRCDVIVAKALERSPQFQNFVLPNHLTPPEYSRYEPGMRYGDHVDTPIVDNGRFRRDVSMTLFISDPATYDGGELVVRLGSGELKIRHKAGDAVVYPTTAIHRVEPVTRGARLAVVMWCESHVREDLKRGILYDLLQVQAKVSETADPATALVMRNAVYNLLKLWWHA